MENTLYYGDNLEILREYIKDETIDLIYLDPPFNSNKNYNVLFGEKNGTQSHAQIEAFEDTWHWDIKAEKTYSEIVEQLPNRIASLIKALRCFLGENDMMAYLVMMAIRLHELHRTLKSTGSIYLHCDPTASHYLKILMDAIFGVKGFRNEIIWNYGRGAGNIKHALPKGHETILFYSKDIKVYWNSPLKPYSEKLLKSLKKDEKGYYYTRGQRTGRRKISNWEKESKIGLKTYIDLEKGGTKCTDVWDDLGGYPTRKESLGYPTQKPEALLARIIRASSNKKDLVLDPFCGCGTTISVAEKLKRKWIGIDITHLAISLMKHRLENTFVNNVSYRVIGEPIDMEGAEELARQDSYQFQWWALSLVGARPFEAEKKRGADRGIDGNIFFHDDSNTKKTKQIILQVKSGHVNRGMIDALKGVVERENAELGVFITLQSPTRPMIKEAVSSGFYKSPSGKNYPKIQILTIEDLLYKNKNIERPPKVAINDITLKKANRYIYKGEQGKLKLE